MPLQHLYVQEPGVLLMDLAASYSQGGQRRAGIPCQSLPPEVLSGIRKENPKRRVQWEATIRSISRHPAPKGELTKDAPASTG